jgi:ribosomal protein S12 methylthiotransferase accessory factor YcaO
MRMIHDQVFGINPHSYLQFHPALAHLPMIFNLTGDCVVGNSSGFQEEAICGGFGEYVERYHFYNEVDINLTASLDAVNAAAVVEKFIALIAQVQKVKASAREHQFDLTEVTNIFTQEKNFIPTVLISLSRMGSGDRDFIPFIDSCGQAAHISQQKAFTSALNEFIERQALVGSWLAGKACYRIELEPHQALGSANKILTSLLAHGKLLAYELNKGLPGYSIIIFYFSKSKKDIVKYSVGMAADLNPALACERALGELWQSYIFMYLNAENPENLDQRYQYLNDLIHFNTHETADIIPYADDESENLHIDDYLSFKKVSESECLNVLKDISPFMYAYSRSSKLFGRKFYFCKISSPDFFMHMGVKMPLNLDNNYAKLLGINPSMKIQNPIPFP